MRAQEVESRVGAYLKTLRGIPADIRLSMATREYEMGLPDRCVCGWLIREARAREEQCDAATVDLSSRGGPMYEYKEFSKRFGGKPEDWGAISGGVCDTDELLPLIEEAFTVAVMEAAGV